MVKRSERLPMISLEEGTSGMDEVGGADLEMRKARIITGGGHLESRHIMPCLVFISSHVSIRDQSFRAVSPRV